MNAIERFKRWFRCKVGLHDYRRIGKFDRLTIDIECTHCGKHREIFDPDPPT